MTTPCIEEMVEEFFEDQNNIWKSETGMSIAEAKIAEKKLLSDILTLTHQAGIEEAVEEKARWEQERDTLFQETNVKKLLEQMEKDLLEYGQYHDPDCLQMSEWADPDSECDCEIIKAMRSFATEWVGKTNEMWVTNLKNHRKHCGAYGNKDLTQRKNKVLGKP